MFTHSKYIIIAAFIAILLVGSTAMAQTTLSTTFTYQGFLSNSGNAVNQSCDFQFSLFPALSTGIQIGTTATKTGVTVSGGVFTVQLDSQTDFGGATFDGTDRYLQIAVRCPTNTGGFTTLIPRQPITSTPYSLYATNAAIAAGLNGLTVQQNATSPNLIGGFSGNTVAPAGIVGSVIGGGGATGSLNQITDNFGVIGGGLGNSVGNTDATVNNVQFATVAGGVNNSASGPGAFVGGGESNTAGSLDSVVAGGNQNQAFGQFAFIGGGSNNSTSADYTFAAGRNAQAAHAGSFVWGDSTNATISSTGNDQFIVRATGGVWFGDNNVSPTLTAGHLIDTSTTAYLTTGGDWVSTSDVSLKDNFSAVDPNTILHKVVELPITSWSYIAQGDSIRHIGPMAQDFYAAFGLGEDDKHISTIDSGGVALAAIQGLYQVVQDKDAQIADLQAENVALRTRLDDLDQRLAKLEALATPSQSGVSLPTLIVAMLAIGGMGWIGRRALKKDSRV